MRDLLGQSAASEERHPLTDLEAGHAVAQRGAPTTRLATRGVARSRLHLVLPATLEHVGERQADRFHVHQDLTRPW